jgi:hypothetical protein
LRAASSKVSYDSDYDPAIDFSTYETCAWRIDIFAGDTEELVWRGTAEGALDPEAGDREQSESSIAAVGEILKRFPPRRD